jgi:glycosyltransferase involved in cell wall biosynthesis
VKLLLVSLYFPPAGGAGVQRPLKFATHLPALGIETHVLAPDNPRWLHTDSELVPPTQAWVHRARYIGPSGRRPAEEMYGRAGLALLSTRVRLTGRRLLLPDENVTWNATAIPAAIRLVKEHGIDVVVTTSPPGSIHLVGEAVRRATGARWIADLRDSLVAHPHRRGADRLSAGLKEGGARLVARLVARGADAVVAVSEAIAEEVRSFEPRGPVVTIANGCDFEDFEGLPYSPGDRFRITHTGSFFGKRDPRPFLSALAETGPELVARFVGDFRAADRDWAEPLGLGDRLELHPYTSRRRALELQRDSEALLLLIPEAGGRGRGVLSGKVFEYLAAERPILAAVPPNGAAAALLRETGSAIVTAPDDVEGLREGLDTLAARWRAGTLEATPLDAELRERLSRRARAEELAELAWSLA